MYVYFTCLLHLCYFFTDNIMFSVLVTFGERKRDLEISNRVDLLQKINKEWEMPAEYKIEKYVKKFERYVDLGVEEPMLDLMELRVVKSTKKGVVKKQRDPNQNKYNVSGHRCRHRHIFHTPTYPMKNFVVIFR